MSPTILLRSALLSASLFAAATATIAQDKIERVWYNKEKTSKIKVFKATDGKFYGKIVWLKYPNDANGLPRKDTLNPKKERRSEPLMGMQILRGLEKDGADEYEGGSIYDPKTGKTYSCKVKHLGDSLALRGYMGISLIGKTSSWTLAE